MDKTITLKFGGSINRLAGNKYGQEIYKTQVSGKIDFESKNIIIIPSQIENVAISFFQGFTKEIVQKVGKDKVFEIVEIVANDIVRNKFYKSVYF